MPRKKDPQTDFGARLVELRKERGLTQTQLAKAAGTSQRMISHYESTTGYPTAPAITSIARALGVSTDQLLGIERSKSKQLVVAETPQARRLWRQFQRLLTLAEKDRRAVIRLLNSLGKMETKTKDARAEHR